MILEWLRAKLKTQSSSDKAHEIKKQIKREAKKTNRKLDKADRVMQHSIKNARDFSKSLLYVKALSN